MSDFSDFEPEIQDLISRFEVAIENNSVIYFDVDDLESIIDSYLIVDEYTKAYDAIKYAYRLHPDSPYIKSKEAELLLILGEYQLAKDILVKISDFKEDNVAMLAECNLRLLDFDTAKNLFTKYITICKPDELDIVFANIAHLFNSYNKPEIANEFLENAVILFPKSKDVKIEQARYFKIKKEYDNAIAIYNMLLDEDPYCSDLWYALGAVFFEKEDYSKAINALDYALAIEPNLDAELIRAHCLFNTYHYKESIEIYLNYYEVTLDSTVLNLLGEAYYRINDLQKSIKYYSLSIEQYDNSSPVPWIGLALSYFDDNNITKAYEILKKSREYVPLEKSESLIHFLSQVEVEMVKIDNDTKYLEMALNNMQYVLKLNPDDENKIFETGMIYLQLADFENAKKYIEAAYDKNPFLPDINIYLAISYYALGDTNKSKDFYNKAKETISNAKDIFISIFPDAQDFIN